MSLRGFFHDLDLLLGQVVQLIHEQVNLRDWRTAKAPRSPRSHEETILFSALLSPLGVLGVMAVYSLVVGRLGPAAASEPISPTSPR